MKHLSRFIVILSIILISFSLINEKPGLAKAQSSKPTHVNAFPVLSCDGKGNGGDRINTNGIRFTVDQGFNAIEVRLASLSPVTTNITADLRHSAGFTGLPDYSITVPSVLITNPIGTTPYQSVRFTFNQKIQISSSQVFTLKISSPADLFIEVVQPDIPCDNALVTYDNSSINPIAIGSPMGFKVLSPDPTSFSINSSFTSAPPDLDGKLSYGEWNLSNQLSFDNGFISVENDVHRLYLLVDLLGEPVDNTNDTVSISVDIDKNHQITPSIDKIYQIDNSGNMRYWFYTGPWPSLSIEQPATFSAKAKGFGCFVDDSSLTLLSSDPVQYSCDSHRIWELALDLGELNASVGNSIELGLKVSSTTPAFTDFIPANALSDFSRLITINLAPSTATQNNLAAGDLLQYDPQPVEVTQAIQNRDNTLPLVAGKDTLARIYVHATGPIPNEPLTVFLYGSSNGIDLPGSPLVTRYLASTSNNRSINNGTANILLPLSWTQGSVMLSSISVDNSGHQATSSTVSLLFSPKGTPTYWLIPVNVGSASQPIIPDKPIIEIQKSFLSTVFPISQVNFIYQPWTALGPQTMSSVMNSLNHFYNSVQIAYQSTMLSTGIAPFTMPDQIYAVTLLDNGQSNPAWAGGAGLFASGYQGSSLEAMMAHAIDHNLDRSATGTWGRNVPQGCDTASADPAWPNQSYKIGEFGLDPRLTTNNNGNLPLIVQPDMPDFMSHCQSNILPTQWISPYRWINLFNTFPAGPTQPPSQILLLVYYLSGQIFRDNNGVISGTIDPVLRQPGVATTDPGTGSYSIQLINSNSSHTMVTFPIQFSDDPGEYANSVNFNFEVPVSAGPDPASITRVILRHYNNSSQSWDILDQINVPQNNVIGLNFTSPLSGASWSGLQTIKWNSNNTAGVPLTYTILYSSNGINWIPVTSGITDTSIPVDTTALPGNENPTARFRLIASDGFNNAQVDSSLFTHQTNSPRLTISSPQVDQFLLPGTMATLSAEAYDVQDGLLPESSIIWLDGTTLLGTGRHIQANLTPGLHTISLVATNSLGITTTIYQQVTITYASYFPVIYE